MRVTYTYWIKAGGLTNPCLYREHGYIMNIQDIKNAKHNGERNENICNY